MSDGCERALEAHRRFESDDAAHAPADTIFDARVTVDDGVVRVENEVPTLDAVVEGERVAPVVEDGWYETFERRVEDVDGVTTTDEVALARVERDDETVRVVTELRPSPGTAGDDALAVVNYVEGTWVEGIIPGYDYEERVQRVRQRAQQNAEG